MILDNICYRCGALAVSREHVPPLCIFPEKKDTHGDFRKNLITVPSCDEHNSQKSKEDEFLLLSIASIVGNNYLGFLHTQTKISRALRRKSQNFLEKAVMRNAKTFVLNSNKSKFVVSQGSPDYHRLVNCFENIAAGLFFKEFNKVFNGEFKMFFGFLKYADEDTNTFVKFARERWNIDSHKYPVKGDNPEVFRYQFADADEFGIIGLKMLFYQGSEIYLAFLPHDKGKPFNLGMHMMAQGVHTILTVDDKEFEFNKPKATIKGKSKI